MLVFGFHRLRSFVIERAAIGLGSNVGDSQAHLAAAIAALRVHAEIFNIQVSGHYSTRPVGVLNQPDFLNAAAVFSTSLPAPALLNLLLAIERSRGRDRTKEERWGPRALDLDLLLFGQHSIFLPGLEVPHPRLHQRRFVLEPLAEIAPDWRVPPQNKTVRELLATLAA